MQKRRKMKKKILVISMLVLTIFTAYISRAAYVYFKYSNITNNYYGIGDSFEYNGIQFEVESIEMFSFNDALEKYNISNEEINIFGEDTDRLNKQYYFLKMKLTKLKEDIVFYEDEVGCYNKYLSGYYQEPAFSYNLNLKNENLHDKKIGESVEKYFAGSLINYYFAEDTWKKMSYADFNFVIIDYNKGCIYSIGKEL